MANEKMVVMSIMFVALTLTFRDLLYNSAHAHGGSGEDADDVHTSSHPPSQFSNDDDDVEQSSSWFTSNKAKKIPHTHLSHLQTGPTLKFLYCYSCGYKRAYEDYAAIIREKYPDMNVMGDNYPPSTLNRILVQVIGLLKMGIIFMILANVNPFSLLGQPTPAIWSWLSSSKLYGCLITFFICNTVEGTLISSGAFEIYYNDVPIWSKIETGRIPQPAELFQIIDNQNLNRANIDQYKY